MHSIQRMHDTGCDVRFEVVENGFRRFNGRIPSNEGEITHMEVVPGVVEIGAFDLSVRPHLPDLILNPSLLFHEVNFSLTSSTCAQLMSSFHASEMCSLMDPGGSLSHF